MAHAQFLFLGTGGSSGIPMIGCSCSRCTSSNPYDKRLRPSGLITIQGKKLLIDAGPDFRYQALRYHINELDGVLITHVHFDHVAGLDELRVYYLQKRKPLPVLVAKPTLLELQRRYDYLFREKSQSISLTAQLDFQVIQEERGITEFLGLPIGHMQFEQGGIPVTGYRFGSFAYVSDIRVYPETIFADLKGVKVLVLSALRKEPSFMHFSLEEAVAFAKKVGAERTYLTHIGHELDHETGSSLLPEGVQMAYDGLTIDFQYE